MRDIKQHVMMMTHNTTVLVQHLHREAKQLYAKLLSESLPDCALVVSVACNCNGSVVSTLMEKVRRNTIIITVF